MASTTATWNDKGTAPSLAAMSAGDDKTISGTHVSRSAAAGLIRDAKIGNGKTFVFAVAGPKAVKITRKT